MPLIPEDIIAQIIDRADIVDVVSEYVSLKKAGQNFKGNSPFNDEKTPSFIVSPQKQIFHCFSSGVGGNVISFIMRMERMTFPEAVRFLAKKVNVDIPESRGASAFQEDRQCIYDINKSAAGYFQNILQQDQSIEAQQARTYLQERGVSLETAQKFQLGMSLNQWDHLRIYLEKQDIPLSMMEQAGLIIAREKGDGFYDRFRNRIMFPIFDVREQCRAFGGRTLGEDKAKYINSPETPVYTKGQHLYGFHLAKKSIAKEDLCIVVEGYMDCLMPVQYGVENIVASLGTALTVEQVRSLKRYTRNIVLLYDTDKAGQAAMLRSIDMLIEEDMHVRIARLDDGEDPDSYIRKHGKKQFVHQLLSSESVFDFKLRHIAQRFNKDRIEDKGNIAKEMLATVRKFPSAVVRSGYIKELALYLNVSEDALGTELQKVNIASSHAASKKEKNIEARTLLTPLPKLERSLIKLLLEEETFIVQSRKDVLLEDIQDTHIRHVMNKIFELFDQGKSVDSVSLMNAFDDAFTQELIAQISADQDTLVGDCSKIYQDCLTRLKSYRLKDHRKRIMEEMKTAEEEGDDEKLEILKEQFNQTIKK